MKTIPLSEAIKILSDASAVVWNDYSLTYPSVDPDDEEFLRLTTVDEGLEYSATFNAKDNQTVKIVGTSMFLIDDGGDELQINVLEMKNLELTEFR